MTVFDIGANIGYYAKVISASLKQQGSIVCVEPMPRALVLLRKNAALCEVPISIESCAVGEVPGRAELLEKNALDVSTVVFASKSAASVRSTTVVTIDDLATKHGPPHMIKIDVEGAELIALKGAQQLLRQRDLIVMFEYIPRNADNFGGYSIEQIVAAFPSRYRVFRIGHPQNLYDYRMIGKSTLTDDYLAVPTKLLTVELATRIYAS
jgi:FkbM family methyltransferase